MELIIDPAWRDQLHEAQLDTVEAVLAFENEHCLSRHNRAATWKGTLPNGRVFFLKKDFYTSPAPILRRLIRFQAPETNTERETRLLLNAQRLGFRIPEIIAHTRHCRWWLPTKGAMIELAVHGRPVDELVNDPTVSEEKKQDALSKARTTLDRLQDAQLDWRKDCKPEHFFYCDDGEITLIDGERLFPVKKPLTAEYRAAQHRRFDSFLPEKYRRQA